MYNPHPREFIGDFGDASWKRIATERNLEKEFYAFGCGVYTISFSDKLKTWCITFRDGKERFRLGEKKGYKDFRYAIDEVKIHNKANPTLNLKTSSRGIHTSNA